LKKNFLEFFAGIGLMRLGLERAGWSIAYANDIDPQKLEMYDAHFGDAKEHFHLGDIHKIAADDLPRATLATAYFPCNDLSLAGSRAGLKGSQSSAYWGFTELIEDMGDEAPSLILLENVPGFLTSHGGRDFTSALRELNRLGYWVDAMLIDAAWFVPQSRLRLFVVATKADALSAESVNEEPGAYECPVRPAALVKFITRHPEINWLIRPLPNIRKRGITLESILDDVPPDSDEWWSKDRVDYLLNQMSLKHRTLADAMISGSRYSYGTVFRRVRNNRSMAELRTDGIAGCLRTPRGGSGRQILFKGGRGKAWARLLNGRECARLMGAGDFKVTVPLNQALFGFGDAVCVPVISWVANNYLNPVFDEICESKSERRLATA
jgi:DNA (cytosine-5)-methyltransferase 1